MSKGTVAELKATKTKATKRPDIQLLRAFAVIAAVGYHFELPGFSYGFLGVDIFLVVSGYLVGGSLIREMQLSGKIDFKRFFSARIKRLLPAALAAVIFTVALLQITNQLTTREIRHAFWSLLYVQNINLGIEGSSYLGGDLNPSYFVHYWSLSLEEQFYIIAPVLLLIIFKSRLGRSVLPILALIAVVSFAFSLMQTLDGEASAYYSILTRAWQFIIGMLTANYLPTKSFSKKLWVIAALLVLFFIGSVSFFPELAFPAPGALLPSLFAGVFLSAGSSVPFRFPIEPLQKLGVLIGDISYSMYLIHFPLALLFLKWSGDQEDYKGIILGLITTFFLSVVSKSFIEDPFRFGLSGSSKSSFGLSGILFANLIFAVALVSWANTLSTQTGYGQLPENNKSPGVVEEGDQSTASNEQHTNDSCIGANSLIFESCEKDILAVPIISPQSANEAIPEALTNGCQVRLKKIVEFKSCYYGETRGFNKTVAIVGDSHATHWIPAFDAAARDLGVRVKTYLMGGCSFGIQPRKDECSGFTDWAIEDLRASKDQIQAVFISNRVTTNLVEDAFLELRSEFAGTLASLSKTYETIYVVGDNPLGSLDNSDPNLCLLSFHPRYCLNDERDVTSSNPYSEAMSETGIGEYISAQNLFCSGGKCFVSIGGLPVYRDDDHITTYYSESTRSFWHEYMNKK